VNTVLTAFDGLVDALEEADYDFLKVDPAALEGLGGEEIEAASERVSEFTDANCS
jgi:hypothetical protein